MGGHPEEVLHVDIAGYLHVEKAEAPASVYELGLSEPERTLRAEVLRAVAVRSPEVRPLLAWFDTRKAFSATIVMDEEGPIGFLLLPRGRAPRDHRPPAGHDRNLRAIGCGGRRKGCQSGKWFGRPVRWLSRCDRGGRRRPVPTARPGEYTYLNRPDRRSDALVSWATIGLAGPVNEPRKGWTR